MTTTKSKGNGVQEAQQPTAEVKTSTVELSTLKVGPKEAEQAANIDDILQKVEMITRLNEDREKFKTHKTKVQGMKISDFGETDFVTLTSQGQTYQIKSGKITRMIADLLLKEMDIRLTEIENKIREVGK